MMVIPLRNLKRVRIASIANSLKKYLTLQKKIMKPKGIKVINNITEIMMSKSNRTIIQTVFLGIFILTGITNVSCGQAKVDKLDKLIKAYAEYGKFNGSVLV